MLAGQRPRRKLFFVAISLAVISILVLLARTAADDDARIPNAVMLVALLGFAIVIVFQLRKGRRNR